MHLKISWRFFLVVAIIFFIPATHAATTSAERLYAMADKQYDAEDYQTAIAFLKLALKSEPDNAPVHHLLGKCYGRLAEESNWLSAIELSQKTLKSFEKAVELNGEYIPALRDLMRFYQDAPGFLGGNKEKAAQLEKKIEKLRAQTQYSPNSP